MSLSGGVRAWPCTESEHVLSAYEGKLAGGVHHTRRG